MIEDIFEGTSSKIINTKEVYHVIRSHGSITKLELTKVLNIPITTINRVIASLSSLGLIEEEGIGISTGGRKPVLYKIKSDMYYLVGVDISRTLIKIVLTDFSLNKVKNVGIEIKSDIEPKTLISQITQNIKSMVKSADISWQKILGIGVGTVGKMDKRNGVILEVEGFDSKNWINFHFKQAIENELGVLTLINNGSVAATLAEYWSEVGKYCKNLAYINVGIGLRCGIVSNGYIVNLLENYNEDVFGHITVSVDGHQCYCGNRGCIERYVSVPAIVQNYKAIMLKEGIGEKEVVVDEVTWETVCKAVNLGEKLALRVITEAAMYLSAGLNNIINILNPEAVVLGGLAINSCNLLYDFAISLTKERLKATNTNILFSRCAYGEDEVAVGSATFILDYYLGRAVGELNVGTA